MTTLQNVSVFNTKVKVCSTDRIVFFTPKDWPKMMQLLKQGEFRWQGSAKSILASSYALWLAEVQRLSVRLQRRT